MCRRAPIRRSRSPAACRCRKRRKKEVPEKEKKNSGDQHAGRIPRACPECARARVSRRVRRPHRYYYGAMQQHGVVVSSIVAKEQYAATIYFRKFGTAHEGSGCQGRFTLGAALTAVKFRRRAEICMRFAGRVGDPGLAQRLRLIAGEYLTRAEEEESRMTFGASVALEKSSALELPNASPEQQKD
jgi:hypothetical protein